MSNITVTIEGIDKLKADLSRIGEKAEANVAKAVKAVAFMINADVKQAYQKGPKTGRIYQRGGVTHQASAPGEAPATDTGTLVSSVYFDQESKMSATVGSRLAYAHYLEFGTRNIAQRPAWVPATERARPKLAELIEKALEAAIK